MKKGILPPTYFMLLLVLLVGAHFVFPIARVVFPPYNYAGVVFVVFGVVINLWADNLFKKNNTTVKPHESPTSFIASGPFSFSRHPMYLGMMAILMGAAVFLGSITSFVFPLAFVVLMESEFIPLEDKAMSERFGSEYADYKKRVRRWM